MMAKKRKPGGGRKPSKPDYNPSAILQNQMDTAVALYSTADHPSLQTIANELDLNPIKVRKLLITAGVYKSDAADQVQKVFGTHRKAGLSHTEAITATMKELNLSKGTRVRVTAGPLEGQEGVFLKVKGARDRRLVIHIEGVIAVARALVHPELVQLIG